MQGLTGHPADHTIELADLSSGVLISDDAATVEAERIVSASRLVVFASPTYKASYTGLMKAFLDRFAGGDGLDGVIAIPLMLGGDRTHALAAEWAFRPLLTELGASTIVPGLHLVDSRYTTDGVLEAYVQHWSELVRLVYSSSSKGPRV